MAYPTLEQYQEALQHPGTALADPILKLGSIQSTGLGLPLVISGGFALTYRVSAQGRQFAVRCFHKEAKEIERRYEAISRRLAALRSPYFLDFVYQPQGVRVLGKAYPIIRMEWAAGETLGEFLQSNYRDAVKLGTLRAALRSLATYLETSGIAHGDIQSGNLMVSPDGKRVQLIDYDGMYVPEVAQLGASELGHRNFQHPRRATQNFDTKLDRFSFIQFDLALRALENNSNLWTQTQSEADAVVFRANDYADPAVSSAFDLVTRTPGLERDAKNFAAVCKGGYAEVPSLLDFLAGKNIPQQIVIIGASRREAPSVRAAYIGPYPVLDASSFELFVRHIGQTVELIGRIVEVSEGRTKRGSKPYVFVNFGDWRGRSVKLSIWSEALSILSARPDASWKGRWVSVKGLVDPLYVNKLLKYESTGITITTAHQIQTISESEAKYRLGSRTSPSTASVVEKSDAEESNSQHSTNSATLASMRTHGGGQPAAPTLKQTASQNQQLLNQIRAQSLTQGSAPQSARSTGATNNASSQPNSIGRYGSNSHYQQAGRSSKRGGWPWWTWLFIVVIFFIVVTRR